MRGRRWARLVPAVLTTAALEFPAAVRALDRRGPRYFAVDSIASRNTLERCCQLSNRP